MLVYDTDGKAHDKEPIDAKECISRLGWTTEPPKPVEPVKTDETDSGDNTAATKGSKK